MKNFDRVLNALIFWVMFCCQKGHFQLKQRCDKNNRVTFCHNKPDSRSPVVHFLW